MGEKAERFTDDINSKSVKERALKLRIFKVIAVLIPVLLLVLLEFCLRAFHYGHDTSLFIPYPDDTSKLVMNRYASEPYFSDTINATKGYIEPFDKVKKANTLRIFVLGESTGEGYPYFHNGSFHRWLQYRLMRELPQSNIEIINLSLTAVNSYTVLGFGKQLADYQPDAILVYVGHNEYYGALGTASTSRIGSNRFLINCLLAMKRLRTVQWLNNTLASLKHTAGSNNPDIRENLMKRMAGKQQLPYKGEAYNKGIRQFSENLTELFSFYSGKKIPIFLSTVFSNEKDLSPFISAPVDSPRSALKLYNQGKDEYTRGLYTDAKRDFIEAKELDMLRFRAPEAMNQIIKHMGSRFNFVHVVDSKAFYEQHALHGILGNEMLLEHVHPNLFGYALLSEAFYQSLKNYKLISPGAENVLTFNELLKQMPVTKIDSLFGSYQIMMLKSGWPFNQKIAKDFKVGNSLAEQLAGPLSVGNITWRQAMDELYRQSMQNKDEAEALRATEAIILDQPFKSSNYLFAGRLAFDIGQQKKAEFYFTKCHELDASPNVTESLILFYIKTDQPEKALAYLKAMTDKGEGQNLITMQAIVEIIVNDKKSLENQPSNKKEIMEKIADDYLKLGEKKLAMDYLNDKNE